MTIKGGERKPHVDRQSGNRVSSAVWPRSTRKSVATGKAAQRRRDWIMQGRWWIILVDALTMRVLLILTTLLVVASSLMVAVLGMRFWYLLPLPLLLFAALLLVPLFLASRVPGEMTPPVLTTFAQEFKSSTGFLSQYAQELRSQPGMLSAEAPATPMPVDPPLVRVLETVDLRATPVKHFLGENPEETGKHPAHYSMERGFWRYIGTESLDGNYTMNRHLTATDVPYSQLGSSYPGELSDTQTENSHG